MADGNIHTLDMELASSASTPLITKRSAHIAMSPSSASADHDDSEVDLARATLIEARHNAREEFGFETCLHFHLSTFAKRNLGCNDEELARHLTMKISEQTTPAQLPERFGGPDYDDVHFKSDSKDEIYSRRELHHDIVYALHNMHRAEKLIFSQGYYIMYTVSDAQLIILIQYLRSAAASLETSYPRNNNEADNDYKNPRFVRTITNEVIIKAHEMLTADCIIFGVRKRGEILDGVPAVLDETKNFVNSDSTYVAYAFIKDIAVDGKLKSKIEMMYVELSTEQISPLCLSGACRELGDACGCGGSLFE